MAISAKRKGRDSTGAGDARIHAFILVFSRRADSEITLKSGLCADGYNGLTGGRVKKTRSVIRLETVPNAEDGLDVPVGIAAQFLSQPADMNIQRAGADFSPIAPDLHQQSFPGDDLAGMPDEQRKQGILLARQAHALGVQYGGLLIEVEREVFITISRCVLSDNCCGSQDPSSKLPQLPL